MGYVITTGSTTSSDNFFTTGSTMWPGNCFDLSQLTMIMSMVESCSDNDFNKLEEFVKMQKKNRLKNKILKLV